MGEILNLEDNRVISNRQFGFRQGKSCVTNLISFHTRVIEGIENKDGWVDAVFLDIKKSIRFSFTQETLIETEAHRWTARETTRIDAGLSER